MVWSCCWKEVSQWYKVNKVYDEITDEEFDETWQSETPDNNEPIRLNGKYVWETSKRVCEFINAHVKTSFASHHSANTGLKEEGDEGHQRSLQRGTKDKVDIEE